MCPLFSHGKSFGNLITIKMFVLMLQLPIWESILNPHTVHTHRPYIHTHTILTTVFLLVFLFRYPIHLINVNIKKGKDFLM